VTPALPQPCLMLVTNLEVAGGEDALVERVEAAVAGGADMVQLREKELDEAALTALALRLRAATAGRALLLVNESGGGEGLRAALAAGADGVQLGERSYGVSAARAAAPGLLVGRSVHSFSGALRAAEQDADYLVAGPVYSTLTHPGHPAAGVQLIADMARAVRTPVIGIGGVEPHNAGPVVAAGAAGVAVLRGLLAAPNPEAAARGIRTAIDAAWAERPAIRRRA
jgi:thiazole tautomerase (transcriptional regulator TenI)